MDTCVLEPYRILGIVGLMACNVVWAMPTDSGDPSPKRITYSVRFQGDMPDALRKALEQHAQTVHNRDRPPASLRQLRYRAQGDIERLEDVLRSYGYYDGRVTFAIATDRKSPRVQFQVTSGPQYRIKQWDVVYRAAQRTVPPLPLSAETMHDRPAEAPKVLVTEQAFLNQLRDQGFPFCKLDGRDVVVDGNDHTIDLKTTIDPGPWATFGTTEIRGLVDVEEGFVRRRIKWSQEQRYQQSRLHDLEAGLLQCGLFASARVRPATEMDPNGTLPVMVELSERKHRTIRLGGTYVSDQQGLGGRVSWEHRNFGGNGRKLRTEFSASEIDWQQSTLYEHPDFKRQNLDLLMDLVIEKSYPDAFKSESLRGAATLQYQMQQKPARVWAGIAQEASMVEQLGTRQRFLFLEFPLGLDWDRRDDAIDSRQGWRFVAQTTPYADGRSSLRFFRNRAEGRYFCPLAIFDDTVFAGRLAAGWISGAALASIPADKRFYAGGAGSVRGYRYQSIGPTTAGVPSGGLSLLESSFELRTLWDEKIGTVLFLDGGTALSEIFRQGQGEPMHWGAGLGLRYALGFAPLRVDVAFPMNRDSNDSEVQLYVSIGQAF